MKRLIIAITLLTVILSMLTSCTNSENANESAVSEDNASASVHLKLAFDTIDKLIIVC